MVTVDRYSRSCSGKYCQGDRFDGSITASASGQNGNIEVSEDELVVSTLEDENDSDFTEGDLSLREAIAIADSGATITFDSSLTDGTIDLVLGELAIDKDLTIQGLGADRLTLDGSFVGGEFPTFSGNDILFGTETLARLNGINALALTESDFVDV